MSDEANKAFEKQKSYRASDREAFVAGYNAALESSAWIPVEERLPESNTPVLVCDALSDRPEATREVCLIDDNAFKRMDDVGIYENYLFPVTHWMPLPPPTNGEE